LYETEVGDQQKAIESYELAASWFENDNAEACVEMIHQTSLSTDKVVDLPTRLI
jgi:viroplasmin and RNaseH domain-containing protein